MEELDARDAEADRDTTDIAGQTFCFLPPAEPAPLSFRPPADASECHFAWQAVFAELAATRCDDAVQVNIPLCCQTCIQPVLQHQSLPPAEVVTWLVRLAGLHDDGSVAPAALQNLQLLAEAVHELPTHGAMLVVRGGLTQSVLDEVWQHLGAAFQQNGSSSSSSGNSRATSATDLERERVDYWKVPSAKVQHNVEAFLPALSICLTEGWHDLDTEQLQTLILRLVISGQDNPLNKMYGTRMLQDILVTALAAVPDDVWADDEQLKQLLEKLAAPQGNANHSYVSNRFCYNNEV